MIHHLQLTQRVEENEEQFEKTSSTMKKEFEHVDAARYQEFSAAIVSWLTTSLQMQEKVGFYFIEWQMWSPW